MKVLIIEDESPASRKLIRLLKDIQPAIEVMEVLTSVEQSINWINSNPQPELIFMDIQLEDGICFEIFESCRIQTPVIFTTAFDSYTLKAFKVNSIDYLLKPISPDELKKALEKFETFHRNKVDNTNLESVFGQLQPKTKERFLIKIGEHYRSIPTVNISCFYITERCSFILVDNGKHYPVDYSLDKIEQMVNPKQFFRVNRNFIVNISAIQDILVYSSNRLKINLNGWIQNEDILVSRERVSVFKEWMDR